MGNEEDNMVMALVGTLAAQVAGQRDINRETEADRSDISVSPWAGRVVGSAYIKRETTPWMQYYIGPDHVYPPQNV